jgi:hypothetical protein
MAGNIISVCIAIVFSGVFLTAFPSINTMLRGVISQAQVGTIPIVAAEVTLMPYILCAIAVFIVIQIVKGRLQS